MTIQKVLRSILVVGIFSSLIVPFVVDSSLFFPYITGKAYTFRILAEVIFALWIVLAIFDPSARPKKSCVLWSILSFLIIVLIANLRGVDPYYSFWSNYERMEGYVTLLHLFGYFLVVASVFNTKKLWDIFLNTFVGVSVVQAFYAFLQAGGVLKVALSADRIDGTLGNATYLAAFMMLSVFITFYLWMKGNSFAQAKYLYISAIILQIITIFLTATRGTLIAVIGGLFLAVILMAILEPKKKALRWAVGGTLVAIAIFVTIVFGFKESSVVQETVALRRLSEISLDSGTVLARFLNWGIAWGAIKESPLLGYGQGNYGVVFDTNYDARMWSQEQWFDRVHNLFFDWLIAAGFLGLISYLSIIASALYYLWRKASGFSNAMKASFTAMFAAYFVHVMFVFDSLTSYIVLFLIFAFIHSQVAKPFAKCEKIVLPTNVARILAVLVLIGAPFMVWGFNGDNYLQNSELISAIRIKNSGEVGASLKIFEKALARDTFGNQETLFQLLDFSGKAIRTQGVSDADKEALFSLSVLEIEKYTNKHPQDSKAKLIAGQFLAQTGNFELASKFIQDVINISPQKQSVYLVLVEILFQQQKPQEALALAKRVYEINTENTNIWVLYVNSTLRSGDRDLYNKLIEEAFTAGMSDKVLALAESNLQRNPDNVQAHAAFAVTHYRLGNSAKAIEILTMMSEKFPESKAQSDLIIKKINAGEKIL
jgi:O-antigen ligase/Flp pilus assembly protein TadD